MFLTRSPLIRGASSTSSFDLHVLSTPPAFVLSQDQTLRQDLPASPASRAGPDLRGEVRRPDRNLTRFDRRSPVIKNVGALLPTHELTSSPSSKLKRLSALAFNLLFRFQGAEALGTHRWAVEVPMLPDCGPQGRSSGLGKFSDGSAGTQPRQEETSTRWYDVLPLRSNR